MPQWERWPTASDSAIDDEAHDWLVGRFFFVFDPLTRWMESAEYATERLWYICHTETLDADLSVICERLGVERSMAPPGHQSRNDHITHGTIKSVLTPDAEAALRERYADDYELLAEIRRH